MGLCLYQHRTAETPIIPIETIVGLLRPKRDVLEAESGLMMPWIKLVEIPKMLMISWKSWRKSAATPATSLNLLALTLSGPDRTIAGQPIYTKNAHSKNRMLIILYIKPAETHLKPTATTKPFSEQIVQLNQTGNFRLSLSTLYLTYAIQRQRIRSPRLKLYFLWC